MGPTCKPLYKHVTSQWRIGSLRGKWECWTVDFAGACLQGFRIPKNLSYSIYMRAVADRVEIPLMVLDLWIILTASQTSSSEQITILDDFRFHIWMPPNSSISRRFVFRFCILFWCSISGTILLASTLPPVDSAKSSVWIVAQFRCLNSHFFHIMGGRWKNQPKCRVHIPNSVGFVYPIYQHLPRGAN